MTLSLVVAVAENGVIGGDGQLLWRIRDDLKRFKSVTMNKPMIMGRKTFDSIGAALPGRDSIVMTRKPDYAAKGAFVVQSASAALSLARACAAARQQDEICIIGGGDIYAQFLPSADRIYLTEVAAAPEGDTVFPKLDSARWTRRKVGDCAPSDVNAFACEFFILDRRPK